MIEEAQQIDLSIIVPVYNVRDYIEECVDSLLNQGSVKYEIILVDDGSDDDSGRICDQYSRDNEIVKVIHKVNGGLGSARNAGLESATGRYVLFVDSDDYLVADSLPELIRIADRDRLDVLLFSGESFADDSEIEIIQDYLNTVALNRVMSGVDFLTVALENRNYIASVCLKLFSKAAITIQFNESYIHEDEDFSFITIANSSRVESIDKRVYMRRYRIGSIMIDYSYKKTFDGYNYAINSILSYRDSINLEGTAGLCNKYVQQLLSAIVKDYCYLSPEMKRREAGDLKRLLADVASKVDVSLLFLRLAVRSLLAAELYCKTKALVTSIL